MPLVWGHAEFVKLVVSSALGHPFDRPQALWQRYQGRRPQPEDALWSPRAPVARVRAGQTLWLCLPRPALVHHGHDGWQDVADVDTEANGLTLYVAPLATQGLAAGAHLDFTLLWVDTDEWDGSDHRVDVV
jgi:glucoamylase